MTQCTVYRSIKKDLTYLFLSEDCTLEDLPEPLRILFAGAEIAMELDLAQHEKLAQANIESVKKHLQDPGYHLQLPPEDDPSGWLDLPTKPD